MALGHIGVNISDLSRGKAHFDAVMPLLGFELFMADANQFSYKPAGEHYWPAIFFYPALDGGDHVRERAGLNHLAFTVADRATVHAVHQQIQQLGCEILHPPQEFPQYHPGYYAVFWRGPAGLTLEAVCHRDGA
jgi:catechol 2,3-dioxygenase-like lactoylglutathione lyase family enzyme